MKTIFNILSLFFALTGFAQQTQQVIYIYDETGRLIQENHPGGTIIQYQFDKVTNREEVVVISTPAPPDLFPENPVLSNTILASGGSFSINFTLQNTGNQTAGQHKTKFYLNQANGLSGAILLDSITHNSLSPGSLNIDKTLQITTGTPAGFWYLLIRSDADSIIAESNENNNLLSVAITIIDCYGFSVNTVVQSHEACQLSNGSAQAIATGGSGLVEFGWNTIPIQQNALAVGLAAGVYQVTATDNNGCTATQSLVITNTGEIPESYFEIDSVSALTVFFDGTNPGNISSYLWNFGNGVVSTSPSQVYTYPFSGSYQVCLTTGNECGSDQYCQQIVVSDLGCISPADFSVNNTSDTEITFSWNYIPEVDSFAVRYRIAGDSTWLFSTTQNNFITLSYLAAGQLYEYQVQSRCTEGLPPWSEVHYFFTNNSDYYNYDKFITTYYGTNKWCTHLLQLQSGEVVVMGGKSQASGTGKKPVIFKITPEGQILWQKELPVSVRNFGCEELSDGHILCCMSYNSITYLVKFDHETGNIIWSKSLLSTSIAGAAFTVDDSDHIYLSYFRQITGPTRLFTIVKHTPEGNVIWSKSYYQSTSSNLPTVKVIKVHNQKIYVAGGFAVGGSTAYFIAKFTSNGTLEWRKFLSESGYENFIFDIQFDSAGNIYYIGSTISGSKLAYGKMSPTGTQIWNRSLPGCQGYRLELLDSLIYLAAFRQYTDPTYGKGLVLISDTTGVLLHQYTYTKDDTEVLAKETSEFFDLIIDRNNGRLWLGGKMADPLSDLFGLYSIGLIKTDLDLSWDCRMQPTYETYFSEGIYFESPLTIYADTLLQSNFSTYALTDSTINQLDSIYCFEGCNVVSAIHIDGDSVCTGDLKNFYYTGFNATSYLWLNAANGDTLSTLPYPSLAMNTVGQVEILLIVSNSICADTSSVLVTVLDKPQLAFWAIDPSCPNTADGSLDVLPSGGTPPYTARWSNGSIIPWQTNLPAGYYIATITDGNGCTAIADTTLTPEYPAVPIAGFSDSTFHLGAQFYNTSQFGASFEWNFGDGTITQDINTATHLFDTPGTYEVCLSAINACGNNTFCRELEIENCLLYLDFDGDGFGDPLMTLIDCSGPSGYVQNNQDCNDNDAGIYPGAVEICDGLDNDCDNIAENNNICPKPTGLSAADISAATAVINWNIQLCPTGYRYKTRYETSPGNWSTWSSWVTINTNAAQLTGLLPNRKYQWQVQSQCGNTYSTTATASFTTCNYYTFFADADGDGYGNPEDSVTTGCNNQPLGFVGNGTDCDDADPLINPGMPELCNQSDDNCNNQVDENACDSDGDSFTVVEGDCNDNNAGIYPGATELCNGIDDNCDLIIDNVTVCPKPTGLVSSNISQSTATVSWNALPCAIQYRVRYRYKINGVWSAYSAYTSTTNNQLALTGLLSNVLYQWQVSAKCSSGWSATAVASFTTASSLQLPPEERSNESEFRSPAMTVFPNPASEIVHITIDGSYEYADLRFYDAQGKLLAEKNLPQDSPVYSFSVSGIPAGTYWFVVLIDDHTLVEKLIIE